MPFYNENDMFYNNEMLSLANVITHLLWSHFKVTFTLDLEENIIGYILLSYGLAQSDHIKRILIYI